MEVSNKTRHRGEIEEENEHGGAGHLAPIHEEYDDDDDVAQTMIKRRSAHDDDVAQTMIKRRSAHDDDDIIYVAVGTGMSDESSMDALSWTLNSIHHLHPSATMVYLIHVYPQIKFIPSPLGMLPKNQVRREQLEKYMGKEENKRRELLQKFFNACSDSKVKVDTMVIESDTVADAILELIPILNIRKLVLGTTKSTLRKVKRRSGITGQILQNAPETCDIKIVCEGKEVKIDQTMMEDQSPVTSPPHDDQEDQTTIPNSFSSCMCFKPKFVR